MTERYLNKLIELRRFFLVSQTSKRCLAPDSADSKVGILLTGYDDPGLAKGHLVALKGDPYAVLIDLTKPAHKQKILSMLAPSSNYRVCWAIVKSREKLEATLMMNYEGHMRRYIANKLNWRIDSHDTIYPSLKLIYGELFIILQHGGEKRRLTFEELERA